MGRIKGRARKEGTKPFMVRVSAAFGTDIYVTVTLETSVGEMKRRIQEAEPRARGFQARRMVLCGNGNQLEDDAKPLSHWADISKRSRFELFVFMGVTVLRDTTLRWNR